LEVLVIRSYGHVVIALTAAACASGGSGTNASAPEVITDEREASLSAALGQRVTTDDMTVSESLTALRADAYRALIAAFAKLGIPAELVNPSTGLVAVTEKRMSRTLAGQPMSRYLSCGETMTGARANQDRIVLSVVSYARPVGTSASRLETRVVATAIDVTGTGSRQPCTTTGELEGQLHKMVKGALGT
jgi:hypothetical protein